MEKPVILRECHPASSNYISATTGATGNRHAPSNWWLSRFQPARQSAPPGLFGQHLHAVFV
jgi:hypothetical protein